MPDALIQPIAADDVAAEVARVAVGGPLTASSNIGGPDKISFADLARIVLAKHGSTDMTVVVDPAATYFGTPVDDRQPGHRSPTDRHESLTPRSTKGQRTRSSADVLAGD